MSLEVLSPLVAPAARVGALAPRPRSLGGLRIGVLDNSKPNADVLLDTVAGLLAAGAAGSAVRRFTKPGASVPVARIEEIVAGVDVLLTGSAD
jgi:hypothetical protein